MKECFACDEIMKKALLYNVEIDYCPKCFGLWFEENELYLAKDIKDENLKWLDIDLWEDSSKFQIAKSKKLCPTDRLPFYEVQYGDSKIKVDVCNICKGVWLDKGEFKKIIKYLQEKAQYEILHNYAKNLTREAWEVFTGPEALRAEILDLLTILKLLNYKFITQHPKIANLITNLPR